MGPFKFGIKMLRLEYKKTFFYALTLVVTVAVVFLFLNYAQNPHLGNDLYQSHQVNQGINSINFGTMMCMVMIFISILAAIFSNNVYLVKKTNEIAVEQMSGGSITEITSYLIGQNFVIGGISIPVGIILGMLLNPIMNSYLYNQLGVTDASIWYIGGEAIVLTAVYIFTLIVSIIMFNSGFVYRNDILTLQHMNSSIKPGKPTSGIRTPVILYWILFIVPFIAFLFGDLKDAGSYLVVSLIGIYGIYGLYSRGLTKIFEWMQGKYNLSKAIPLISIGNLKYSIVKTKSLVITINFAIIGLMSYCIQFINRPKDFAIMFVSYVTCILLMTLMVLYKIMLENDSHAHIFKSLIKLGYVKKQIKQIIKKEVFYYYAVMLFFISVYAIPILVHFIRIQTISLIFGIELFALYFIPIAASSFIAYYNYKNTIFHKEN